MSFEPEPDLDPVLPDPDPAISGAGSVLAGSGLRFKRHGHGSVQALKSSHGQVRPEFRSSHEVKRLEHPWRLQYHVNCIVCKILLMPKNKGSFLQTRHFHSSRLGTLNESSQYYNILF